jgi:hypothetical protein
MNVQKLLLKSLLLALVFGPAIAFSNSLLWTRVTHRYEPPLSGEEMRNWKGSVSELQAELSKREVPYTRTEFLKDSLGQRFFWIYLAKSSLAPALGVFLSCICFSVLDRRTRTAWT